VKNVNKKNARKVRAKPLNAAQSTALKMVRTRAFDSGVSRNALIASVAAALGPKPTLTLYNAGKLALQVGFMAAALARKDDNREPSALFADCEAKITLYQGHGGAGKLRKGMKGRRTKVEEEAYGSARVLISKLMSDAGVKVPETRGGNTANTRNKKGANNKRKASAETKPVIRTYRTADALIEAFHTEGARLSAIINKNAKLTDPRVSELRELVALFAAKVKAII